MRGCTHTLNRHTHTHTYKHIHTPYRHMHTLTHTYTHCTHTNTYMHTCIQHTHTTHTHTHTHKHTHCMHAHTHTHTMHTHTHFIDEIKRLFQKSVREEKHVRQVCQVWVGGDGQNYSKHWIQWCGGVFKLKWRKWEQNRLTVMFEFSRHEGSYLSLFSCPGIHKGKKKNPSWSSTEL